MHDDVDPEAFQGWKVKGKEDRLGHDVLMAMSPQSAVAAWNGHNPDREIGVDDLQPLSGNEEIRFYDGRSEETGSIRERIWTLVEDRDMPWPMAIGKLIEDK
ncbi:hypothetical protein BSZ35_19175 [Salinibacter sp. 10B]|uniref:hypothetical protein n=1 Tax=Salinibacter sp. 10B TaxID=1923971 RepID=UPI000CF46176|nr:hypothetical protein [Salinibacter sp. 10B]PQJ26714.1 hypothetical protein BSZ35_19175 [Salinibacter sp. 10B]